MKYLYAQLWAIFVGIGAICYQTYSNSLEAIRKAEEANQRNSTEHEALLQAVQGLQSETLGLKGQIADLREEVAGFSMGVNKAQRMFGNPPNRHYNAPKQTDNDTARVFRFTELARQFAQVQDTTAK